jgi:hypothetical protein
MQQGPGRFELILSLQEVVVLFFVMIVLFTGLLFFGYRVGYTQSSNNIQYQSKPLAPAQETPQFDQERPTVEAEPEIRMENSAPAQPEGHPLFAPPFAGHAAGDAGLLAQVFEPPSFGARPQQPCRAGSPGADSPRPPQSKASIKNRLTPEASADWGTVSRGDDLELARQPAQESAADAISDSGAAEEDPSKPDAVDCVPAPAYRRVLRSIAC